MKDASYFQRICEFSLQFTFVFSNIEMNPPPPPNSHFMLYFMRTLYTVML